MFRPHTAIFRCYSILPPEAGALLCQFYANQHHIGENWHNRAPAFGGEYTITPEDGHVRPKHVDD
jgi:hypothetical protein